MSRLPKWLVLALGCCSASLVLAEDEPVSAPRPRTVSHSSESALIKPPSFSQDVEYLQKQSNVLKEIVKATKPTVVHIEADKFNSENGRSTRVEESGSGFVAQIKQEFYVITNRHVVRQAALRAIRVKLADGRIVHPDKILADADTDIALLRLTAPKLVAADIGDSNQLEIGDFVLAVGSPFGLSHSVTFGIISATGRRDLELPDEIKNQDFIQTDAAINPGNSGGPLLNLRGEVVAVNTAIATNTGGYNGIGFAIPINMVMQVANQLADHGFVTRSEMGVTLDRQYDPEAASKLGITGAMGARIHTVYKGSPAAEAHIMPGDVILEFDGRAVEGDGHLPNLVNLTPVGKEVPVVVYRDQQRINLSVKLRERAGDNGRRSENRGSEER